MFRWSVPATFVLVAALAIAPTALSALDGSGQVEDLVLLDTNTATVSTLTSAPSSVTASGAPVASATAFEMDNAGSNVDTFLRYSWSTPLPYYGGTTTQNAITIRAVEHAISDLLFFQQSTTPGGGSTDTSDYFSPLLLNDGVGAAAFTSDGDACVSWSGTAPGDFSKAASGTFTFEYYPDTGMVNDAPETSDTYYWCADSTDDEIFIGRAASFTTATRLYPYATESAGGTLLTYQYEALSGSQTNGNFYCLVAVAGTGITALPELAQCSMLPYSAAGSSEARLYPLFDPPAYFPSVNQGGAITYEISGVQWNPYDSVMTQNAG